MRYEINKLSDLLSWTHVRYEINIERPIELDSGEI